MLNEHLRRILADACLRLRHSGVLSASGHGNFSARLESERMLLTPAGMSSSPHPDDLAVVRFDGTVETGRVTTSVAEIVGMHAVVYRCRPDAGAVVHTHSPGLTAFAVAHLPLPCRYEALLRLGHAGDVPVAAWGPRGSRASLDAISAALNTAAQTQAVLLANHGLLAFAADPTMAASLVVVLEEAAAAELGASLLGGGKDFRPAPGAGARDRAWPS